MILSYDHRFAFIKVQKTAGTSVEVVLAQVAGDSAIVTPVTPPETGHVPRNFEPAPDRPRRFRVRRRPEPRPSRPTFYNHMPASEVSALVGRETWEGLYRFCFERNPWDKAISMYFWRTRRLETRPPFEAWATTPGSLVSARSLYMIDGELAVDFIGRYESLAEDLDTALAHVGLRAQSPLPRAKGQHRTDTPAISPAVDAVIRREFAWEIEHLGYERPEPIRPA